MVTGNTDIQVEVALERILAQLRRLRLPISSLLQEGLAAEVIQARTANLPCRLPAEVSRYFQWRNGTATQSPVGRQFFPGAYILSLEEAVVEYEGLNRVAQQVTQNTSLEPALIWNPRWFPVFQGTGGTEYFVIVCDGKEATKSLVYHVNFEDPDAAYLAYDSLDSMLHTIAECYETGAYSVDATGLLVEDSTRVGEIVRVHNPERVKSAIQGIRDKETVIALVQQLKERDGRKRGDAAKALINLKDEAAVIPLTQLVTNVDPDVRSLAIRVLGEFKDSRAVKVLIGALEDSDVRVQSAAAQALGDIRSQEAIDPLIRVVQRPATQAQLKAIWALGQLRSEKSADALVLALEHQNGAIRAAAAQALGKTKDRRATVALIRSLDDQLDEVRLLAAWALGELRDPAARDPLVALLENTNQGLRRTAEASLRKIPGGKP